MSDLPHLTMLLEAYIWMTYVFFPAASTVLCTLKKLWWIRMNYYMLFIVSFGDFLCLVGKDFQVVSQFICDLINPNTKPLKMPIILSLALLLVWAPHQIVRLWIYLSHLHISYNVYCRTYSNNARCQSPDVIWDMRMGPELCDNKYDIVIHDKYVFGLSSSFLAVHPKILGIFKVMSFCMLMSHGWVPLDSLRLEAGCQGHQPPWLEG